LTVIPLSVLLINFRLNATASTQVADLKEVLRKHGQPVSGTKAQLQNRLQQLIDIIALDMFPSDTGHDDFDEESSKDLSWMGSKLRSEASLPIHITHDHLAMAMIDTIGTRYPGHFLVTFDDSPSSIQIDDPHLLRDPYGQRDKNTKKYYTRYGSLFIIFIYFYSDVNLGNDQGSPIFTARNSAAFFNVFRNMHKKRSIRGDTGHNAPTMTMINQLAMVINFMNSRERNAFKSLLSRLNFEGKETYFSVKPASKNNCAWAAIYKEHKKSLTAKVAMGNHPHASVLKDSSRFTDDQMFETAHSLLAENTVSGARHAAMIAASLIGIVRSETFNHAQLRDMSAGMCRLQTPDEDRVIRCISTDVSLQAITNSEQKSLKCVLILSRYLPSPKNSTLKSLIIFFVYFLRDIHEYATPNTDLSRY